MSTKLPTAITSTKKENKQVPSQLKEKISFEKEQTIQIRELDKRYTHANPKNGKCTMESCNNRATHWLTRNNAHVCQSDMVCNQHAMIWMEVKELLVVASC